MLQVSASDIPVTSSEPGTSAATDGSTPSINSGSIPIYVWPIAVIAIAGVIVAVILAIVVFVTKQRKKATWQVL